MSLQEIFHICIGIKDFPGKIIIRQQAVGSVRGESALANIQALT